MNALEWRKPLLSNPSRGVNKKNHKRTRPRKKADGHQIHSEVIDDTSGLKRGGTLSGKSIETLAIINKTAVGVEESSTHGASTSNLRQPSHQNTFTPKYNAEGDTTEAVINSEIHSLLDNSGGEPSHLSLPSAMNAVEDPWIKVTSRPSVSKGLERKRTLPVTLVSKKLWDPVESSNVCPVLIQT